MYAGHPGFFRTGVPLSYALGSKFNLVRTCGLLYTAFLAGEVSLVRSPAVGDDVSSTRSPR